MMRSGALILDNDKWHSTDGLKVINKSLEERVAWSKCERL